MPACAKVALIRTSPATVLQDYQRLMELAEFRQSLDSTAATILKANLSWHFPFPAANTTPWQLEGVVRTLRGAGYADLLGLQTRTVITNVFKGEDLNGYLPIFRAYGIPVRSGSKDEDTRWVRYVPKTPMLVLDRICPDLHIPNIFFGKNIVHLPTVKCHPYMMAGAMKNACGGLLDIRQHDLHPALHEMLVDLLAIQREIHPGMFAVMDGTTAGKGPRGLNPEVKNVILAAADPVAIDAVAAKLMGFDPLRDLKYVRLAHERGLGTGDVRAIELVGDTDLAAQDWGFSIGNYRAGHVNALLRFDPLRELQRFLMRTPLARLLVLGVESYYDYYRWPVKDRQIFESWLRSTSWGALFQRYQQQGYQYSNG